MSGVEIPVGIVGLISSALALTCGCMQGFDLLKTAWRADRDIETFGLMIFCEQREFEHWIKAVGLLDGGNTLQIASDDLKCIEPILEQLQALLTDLTKIWSKYNPDLDSTSEEVNLTNEQMIQSISQMLQNQTESVQVRSQIEHGSRPLRQKLKWVVSDKARAKDHLKTLRYFVKRLNIYLNRAPPVLLDQRVELMRRTQISELSGSRDSSIANMTIATATNFSQETLTFNLLPDSQSSNIFAETNPATPSSVGTSSHNALANPAETPVEVVSLREYIKESSSPSLDLRLRLAMMLLSNVLQLHTNGWFHTALYLDTFLSFVDSGPVTRRSTLSNRRPVNFSLRDYTYARADEAMETSDPLRVLLYAMIYRHPRSLGPSRAHYRSSFDLFSIGCMLIEIGLWSTLESIFGNQSWPENCDFEQTTSYDMFIRIVKAKGEFVMALNARNVDEEGHRLPGRILARLKAAAGEAYANIVLACLTATELEASRDDINEFDFTVELEEYALQQLGEIVESMEI